MIDGLKPYPAMKDSGVPWLGEVPGHWEIKRGKAIFRCIDIRSSTGDEELLTVSSDRGVVPRSSATVTMFKAESYIGYKLCWPGDLVINSLWAWGRGLGVSRHHGIVSSAYGVYRLQRSYGDYASYIHELVRSAPFNWELQVRSKGIWVSRLQLTDEAFLGAPFPMPPTEEQAAIVRFLDHADRRIRRYIRAKQKLIKLLEEQKQAIIHQAVTGRIDVRTGQPYPAYKNSGVEWLGEVPEHWEIRRAKAVCSAIVDCKNRTPDAIDGGSYLVVRTTCVRGGRFDSDGGYATDEDNFRIWTARGAPRHGDVFFTREAPAGEACLVPDRADLCMGQRMMYFRPDPELLDPEFLLLSMYGPLTRTYVEQATNGSTVGHLRLGQIYALPVLWCPLAEQRAIVRYVRDATKGLERTQVGAEQEIALLHEYRTRLIADVVTGKLDVREAAARLPDEGDEPLPDAADDESIPDEPADDLDALPEEAEA